MSQEINDRDSLKELLTECEKLIKYSSRAHGVCVIPGYIIYGLKELVEGIREENDISG